MAATALLALSRRGLGRNVGRTRIRPECDYPLRRASTACGAELACARAAIPACNKVCALVRLAASEARSASRIRDSAAARLVNWDDARLMAYPNWFCPRPTTA